MPNTYTKLHIQFVFAVKYRAAVIDPFWKDELYKYMTGIIQNQKHKLLSINGMPDHIRYIESQEEHHTKRSFREEYIELLTEAEIDYDERFIFKDPVNLCVMICVQVLEYISY